VLGNIFECAEDEWTVWMYERASGKMFRIGSGYLNRPSGLVIGRSTPSSGSTTGWSLYVSEFTKLWEIPNMAAPAPRMSDTEAPPVGKLVGWMPSTVGTPRALTPDPAGNGFLVSTSAGTIERVGMDGSHTTLAGAAQGLFGDLTAIATNSTGHVLVGSAIGMVFDCDPNSGYASTIAFSNGGVTITTLQSLLVDALDQPILIDRVHGPNAGGVYRLTPSGLELRAFTARGVAGAIDPLTGDLFVTEQGSLLDGAGEILRVDLFSATPASGHYRGDSFFELPIGPRDGGIAFAASGDFYVVAGKEGHVYKVDRSTGAKTIVAGGYSHPLGVTLAPGTPGIAGPQGTSLFVLDAHSVYEIGVDGLPAGSRPTSNPNLAPRADLMVHGFVSLGGATPISIHSPADAGRLYVVFPSVSGKVPGFPTAAILGDFNDPRVIPNNPDSLWNYVNGPGIMPGMVGVLDPSGDSDPTMSIILPNNSAFLVGAFIDLTWVALDGASPNLIATIGGTAQMYLGL